jgi:cytochrome P450
MASPALFDEFDPTELQDGLLTPVGNVHERLREARERHPVMLGNAFTEVTSEAIGDQIVTVLGYDECHRVLTDPDTFSSSVYAQIFGPIMGRTLAELEGAEHRTSRALVSPSFRAKLLDRWRNDLVAVVVDELIDRFASRGRADLVREFTFVFPVYVIARVMGLPRADSARFQRLSIELLNVFYNWDRGIAASASLKEYFRGVLAERRREPRDDLITTLAQSEIDGTRLTDDEIFAFLLLILPAGFETTYRATGNLLVGLLREPALLHRIQADRAMVHGAIEEALRWEPPIASVMRVATRDCELGGIEIPAGTTVNVSIAAANRDPLRYPDPDRFDPTRTNIAHLTFGAGPHLCLGAHLARMETTVAVNALLDRLPDMRLDASEPMPIITGVAFRSPAAVPIEFTPA